MITTLRADVARKTRAQPRLRGASLIEALLALGIGGVVLASSLYGISEYGERTRVEASASTLQRLAAAADRYAENNFDTLVASAPQELPIDVLDPYYAAPVDRDAFGNRFRLSTRTYTVSAPEPIRGAGGGTVEQEALQVLVVADQAADSELAAEPALRAEVANTAGGNAGFVTRGDLTCSRASGSGARPDGHVCGAFGGFSFAPARFPATDFDDVAFVALATRNETNVYEDNLYRYDFGDDELSAMHTTLYMNGATGDHRIVDPNAIDGVDEIRFKGGAQRIATAAGKLTVGSEAATRIDSGTELVLVQDTNSDSTPPRLQGTRNQLQFGRGGGFTSFGARSARSHDSATRFVGGANTHARNSYAQRVRAEAVNSLFNQADDPLRLQKVANGEVIVGKRVRYKPGGGSGRYEISDGEVSVGHLRVQDITCADCGGSLSQVLPRWRRMGTYLIPAGETRNIPKPACTEDNRRGRKTRAAKGGEARFREGADDRRYDARIILKAKQVVYDSAVADAAEIDFVTDDRGTYWSAAVDTASAGATGLASTFCVFTGGNPAPRAANFPARLQSSNGGGWTRIE